MAEVGSIISSSGRDWFVRESRMGETASVHRSECELLRARTRVTSGPVPRRRPCPWITMLSTLLSAALTGSRIESVSCSMWMSTLPVARRGYDGNKLGFVRALPSLVSTVS